MIYYSKNLDLNDLFYINDNGLVCCEEWRNIPGYENKYHVSNLGRVKSFNYLKKGTPKILKLKISKKDRVSITLCKKRKHDFKDVSVVVAMAFLNHVPCGYKLVVDHINDNPLDNRLSNLQIITQRQNAIKYWLKINREDKKIGAVFCKKQNAWLSSIHFKGRRVYLGCFKTQTEASEYYESALKSIINSTKIKIKKPNFSSKHKGVSFNKLRNKWQSYYGNKENRVSLGSFKTEEEAYQARQKYIDLLTFELKTA